MAARGRLGVGIIGAGRVGPVLGAALAGAGHAIVGVATTSEAGRERAETLLSGAPVLEIPDLVERSELVLLAIPDGEIEALAEGLASTSLWQPGQIVAHTSAQYGTGVLSSAQACGAIPLAIHPAMVFSGTSLDLARLAESYCAVTAAAPVLPIGQALVVEMGAEPVVIAEADRRQYAEAIATARTFSQSIVTQTTQTLAAIGVDAPSNFLSGLLRSSVDEALRKAPGPPESLDDVAEQWRQRGDL